LRKPAGSLAAVRLHPFTREDLATVEPWFRDPDTARFLGGPAWPARMLEIAKQGIGEEFRGAVKTGTFRYIAEADGRPFGYIDCGTYDRCTVCDAHGPDGPIITETIDVETAAIAFVVDPQQRGQGLGRAMIAALIRRPELRHVRLFEAGVEPDNSASRRSLEAVGFRVRSEQPDFEGFLYYRCWRADLSHGHEEEET
jgi:RimJ/RimL family protein N-acetyltransferase